MKKKYTIDDFNRGDEVYHLTDERQKMIVIELNSQTLEIKCRWMKDGNEQVRTFIVEELAKDIENWDGFLPITLPFNLQTLQLEFTSLWGEVSKMMTNIREGKIGPNENITVL
jgi:hypothetical protein